MQRDADAVLDMLLAADSIGEFLKGVSFDEFCSNYEKQSAVVYQIAVLGEAAKRLSNEFRTAHNSIPWSRIAGMRDRLIHAYDKIDLKVVWDAVTFELPPVVNYLKRLAPRE